MGTVSRVMDGADDLFQIQRQCWGPQKNHPEQMTVCMQPSCLTVRCHFKHFRHIQIPLVCWMLFKFKHKYASYLSTFTGSCSFIQSAKSCQWSVVFQGSFPLKKSGQMVLCETWKQVNFHIQVGRICGCLNVFLCLFYSRVHTYMVIIWIIFYSSCSGNGQS